jgi:hypothetical protein
LSASRKPWLAFQIKLKASTSSATKHNVKKWLFQNDCMLAPGKSLRADDPGAPVRSSCSVNERSYSCLIALQ